MEQKMISSKKLNFRQRMQVLCEEAQEARWRKTGSRKAKQGVGWKRVVARHKALEEKSADRAKENRVARERRRAVITAKRIDAFKRAAEKMQLVLRRQNEQ